MYQKKKKKNRLCAHMIQSSHMMQQCVCSKSGPKEEEEEEEEGKTHTHTKQTKQKKKKFKHRSTIGP
jgi:hypothetical protein